MTKNIRGSLMIVSIVLLLWLIGCSGNDEDIAFLATAYQNDYANNHIIEITDYDFALQIQEIQTNRDDFIGRTIRYEGMFLSSYWEGETIYFIGRLEGGCCGLYAFEVYLNNFHRLDDETWVEVTGILEEFYVEATGRYFMRLNVIALEER